MKYIFLLLLFLLMSGSCKTEVKKLPSFPLSEKQIEEGKKLVAAYGCINCHQIPGVGGVIFDLGPPLGSWSQRKYIAGKIPNDPDNLIKWLLQPHGVEKSTTMPDLRLSPQEARSIAVFLFSLN